MPATIGHLDWTDCVDCEHCDPVKGGCAVAEDEWKDNLVVEYDSVECGSYKKRESNEDEKS